MMMNFKKNQNNAVCSMDCKNCPNGASQPNPMDDSMFEKSIAMLHNWVMLLMMLYSPGTRTGLIEELQKMQKSLTGKDRNLRRWTASLLAKLAEMTDAEYEALDLYPDE